MFDKSVDLFPAKNDYVFLSHCSISPLYGPACGKEKEMAERQMNEGAVMFAEYEEFLDGVRSAAADLLKTSPDNLAFVKNTSEGIGLVAAGYPFQEGDQVLSYIHEYPANHYPWKLQEQRGVELVLLPDRNPTGQDCGDRPCGWAMSDLESLVTDRTRILALSHVQFTSGYAADLKSVGEFCRARGIDLVIDAAQSLGSLPVCPEETHISAVAASGWKWLLGPVGTGLLYTSPEFREKLGHVMVGAEVMLQGVDYLNHAWQPHLSAKRFEYSTSPVGLAVALETCLRGVPLKYGVEEIRQEIFRLQNIFIESLDSDRFSPLQFGEEHRSGILSVLCKANPVRLAKVLERERIVCSSRGGYLRLAPHFCNTEEEIRQASSLLNEIPLP